MAGARRFLVLLYPAGFAAGYVLISFAATPTPVGGIWRPLVVAVLGSTLIACLLALAFRRIALGALLGSVAVLVLSAPWLAAIIVGAGAIWLVLVSILRRRRKAPLPRLSVERLVSIAGVVSAMFLVVSLVTALPAVRGGTNDANAPIQAKEDAPDIVVLLLDGYPRSDMLRSGFSLDNEPFERALSELGFSVKSASRSNYSATWATLASMMNGRYLDDVPGLTPFPEDQAEQYRALSSAIDSSTLPQLLRSYGYEIAWVPSPFENASLNTADRVLSGGQLTAFELSLISDSLVLPIIQAVEPDFVLNQHRDRTIEAFDQMQGLVQPDDTPTFALVHVLSPHPPMIFAADGDLPAPATCLPECSLWALVDDAQWSLFPGQVTHLNDLVVQTMAEAIEANPDAVLVVMSDHGTKPPGGAEASVLSNFTAIRLPDGDDAVPNDVSPVNLLPEILNRVLDTDLPTSEYRGWISEAEMPLTMEPVP